MIVARAARFRAAAAAVTLVAGFGWGATVGAQEPAVVPGTAPAVAAVDPAAVPASMPLAGSGSLASTTFIAASGPVAINSDGLTAASGPVAVPSGSPLGPVTGSDSTAVAPGAAGS